MKQPKEKIIKHLSGTQVKITNKKIGKTVRLEVESSLLNDEKAYNSPRSYVTQTLINLFKNDINPN